MKNKTKQKKKLRRTAIDAPTSPAPAIQPQPAASHHPVIPHTALPPDTYLSLQELSDISGMSTMALFNDHVAKRLRVRRIEGSVTDQTLFVHAYHAADYMCQYCPIEHRWLPEKLNLGNIDAGRQPRIKPAPKEVIEEIATHIIQGGPIKPIWVMKVDGKIERLDGQRRALSTQAAGLEDVQVIFIPFAPRFADAIAIEANRVHGDNLTDTDLVPKVCAYLQAEPGRLAAFLEGKITNKEVANATGASTATVTKARQVFQPPKPVDRDPVQVLVDYDSLYRNINHRKPDWETIALVGARVFTEIAKMIPKKTAKLIKKRLKLKAHPLSRDIKPSIRQLLDGRGGDQRIQAKK